MTIDLIIPAYKPDNTFLKMVDEMLNQSLPVNKVIVMNVEQKYFDRLMYSSKFTDEHKNMEIHHIAKRESDAGKLRNMGAKLSNADYFIMMSQNAMPVASDLIAKLLHAFETEKDVAVAYARQILMESASEAEKYVLRYYFPEDSHVRSSRDIEAIGTGAYHCSNVCAMYKKSIFDELGGFLNHVIANEDVLYASKVINEGYKVSYVADAIVVNTEEHTDEEYSKICFDRAVSWVKHPETFDINAMKDEVKKLEKMTLNHLKRSGFRTELISYKRTAHLMKKGYNKGLKYKKFASMELHKFSANPEYWRMDEILRDRSAVDVHSGYGRSQAEVEMLSTPAVKQHKFED